MAVPNTFPCTFLLCLFGIVYSTQAKFNNGFSVNLIHHESPKSPYNKSLATPSQHYVNALHHSIQRARYLLSKSSLSLDSVQTDIFPTPDGGGYTMNISIGTPPFEISGNLDTGSDLIWVQCVTCKKCFKQNAPFFNPKNSKTYKNATCKSTECQKVFGSGCSKSGRSCNFTEMYGDASFSTGNVAVDTVTMNSAWGMQVKFQNIVFGCAHKSRGTFSKEASGIIGLGGGNSSLVSQLGSRVGGKFSYCLPPLLSRSNTSSKINFGDKAVVSGPKVVSTPIVTNRIDTFYSLTLEGMSVGKQRFDLFANGSVSLGNVIIDSGTTFTFLPNDFFKKVEEALAKENKHKRLDGPDFIQRLCYKVDGGKLDAPTITAHFTHADVPLLPVNTFLELFKGVHCFTFAPMSITSLGGTNITGIIGNIAQTNLLIGYDLKKRTVSFKPTDCTH